MALQPHPNASAGQGIGQGPMCLAGPLVAHVLSGNFQSLPSVIAVPPTRFAADLGESEHGAGYFRGASQPVREELRVEGRVVDDDLATSEEAADFRPRCLQCRSAPDHGLRYTVDLARPGG